MNCEPHILFHMILLPDCDLQDLRDSSEELKDQVDDTSSKEPPSKSVRNTPLQEYLLFLLMTGW